MSRIRKVGKDVIAEDYWRERSAFYASRIEGSYHRHRLAMVEALIGDCDLKTRICVDVGCGEGIFSEYLLGRGARVIAFDPAEEMARSASERLHKADRDLRVFRAGVEGLRTVAAESVDFVFALNVIAYLRDDEESLFYKESARALRRGGTMVVTHSNELFDLYTLNRFTVEFFQGHFCGVDRGSGIRSLLAQPDKPERVSFNIRENPLTYRYKLAAYGFDEVQQEFANLHEVPPALMDPEVLTDINRRAYANTLGWDEKDRWKLLFMCSMFGSRSVKR
jgi:2-polyprenyl-3-methyl-5-hydroxy-6-metoxy-1,4-benzoquinol methylase